MLQKLKSKWDSVEKQPYRAMYSSMFGGITVDPAMMMIPLDDHMVHRGHGVFDTAMILDGYELELGFSFFFIYALFRSDGKVANLYSSLGRQFIIVRFKKERFAANRFILS